MPVHKMALDGSVFFAKQVGYIDSVDLRLWANALENYAKSNDRPLIALIDLVEVDRLCPTVIKVFTTLMKSPNVIGISIVTGESMASRNAAVMRKISEMRNVRIFNSMVEAQHFSKERANPQFGMFTLESAALMRALA